MTKHRKIVALILALALLVSLVGCRRETFVTQAVTKLTGLIIDNRTDQVALTVQGHSTQTSNLFVLEQSDGTDVLTVDNDGAIASGGAVTFEDDVTITLGAAQNVLVDAATTAHTETDGALDVNMATITADVSAVNVAATTNDGATTAEDAFAMVVTLTQDDADGDLFGISMTAAASTNAAAGSYEAGFVYACAEDTSGACLDGIRLTAAGHATGMTDGLDASHTGIVNAVNIGSNLILGGDDSVSIGATDDTLILTSNDSTATFMGADAAGAADTIYDTTGAGAITVGSDDVTNVTVNSNVGLTFSDNSDSVNNLADATFDFTRNDTGVVTFTCSDDDGTAGCVYDAGLASPIVVGSADVTIITLQTDDTGDGTDLVLPAQGVNAGEILNDTITFAQISDSSAIDADTDFTMADGIELSLTPSHTDGTTEALLIDMDQVDDGDATDNAWAFKIDATSESGDAGDTFYGVGIVWEEGAANTIMDAAIFIDNEETTASTMTDAILVTSSGVNLGVTDAFDASATNIVNAINIGSNFILGGDDTVSIGATDDTLIFDRNDSGSVTYTCTDDDANATCIYDSGGTGAVEVGSADTTNVTVNSDVGLTFANNSESIYDGTDATFDFTRNDSGTVIITASDDDATAALTIDSGGAADLTLGSADATGVDLVANGNMDITIGGATDYIFKANEFEVQAGSVINHSSGTNEGVVWICEKAVSHTDVETTVTMCVIPANANIVDVTFTVETQWNDGVSAVIDCGINAGDVDAYVDNHNINDAADVNRTGDNADMPFLTALGDVGGSAITVDCTIDEGNVDANAGAATLRIFYFLD